MKEIFYVVEIMNGVMSSVKLFNSKDVAEEHFADCIDGQEELPNPVGDQEISDALDNGYWEYGDGYIINIGSSTPSDY
jgi:hypothetical protein